MKRGVLRLRPAVPSVQPALVVGSRASQAGVTVTDVFRVNLVTTLVQVAAKIVLGADTKVAMGLATVISALLGLSLQLLVQLRALHAQMGKPLPAGRLVALHCVLQERMSVHIFLLLRPAGMHIGHGSLIEVL